MSGFSLVPNGRGKLSRFVKDGSKILPLANDLAYRVNCVRLNVAKWRSILDNLGTTGLIARKNTFSVVEVIKLFLGEIWKF